ncbi:hypothetical protein [Haloferula sargassicola]|uniref:hypothetical protein n=1 Tax=Haloferula sargassicola TaxID=490096 RepID=UPI003365407D
MKALLILVLILVGLKPGFCDDNKNEIGAMPYVLLFAWENADGSLVFSMVPNVRSSQWSKSEVLKHGQRFKSLEDISKGLRDLEVRQLVLREPSELLGDENVKFVVPKNEIIEKLKKACLENDVKYVMSNDKGPK